MGRRTEILMVPHWDMLTENWNKGLLWGMSSSDFHWGNMWELQYP